MTGGTHDMTGGVPESDEPALHYSNGRIDHYAGGRPDSCSDCAEPDRARAQEARSGARLILSGRLRIDPDAPSIAPFARAYGQLRVERDTADAGPGDDARWPILIAAWNGLDRY